MATVQVAFSAAMQGLAPVVACIPEKQQVITSSGTSQATTVSATNTGVCTITATGGNVWVAFGVTPVAVAGTHWLVLDGQTRDFGSIAPGFKVAVIDA